MQAQDLQARTGSGVSKTERLERGDRRPRWAVWLLALLLLCWSLGCRQAPPADAPWLSAPPYQAANAAWDHELYVASDRVLIRYRAVANGLQPIRTIFRAQDATVGLAAFRDGVFWWRDGTWNSFTRELESRREIHLGYDFTYSEYSIAATSWGVVADLGRQIASVDSALKIGPPVPIPGIADSILVDSDIAYILDPVQRQHVLIKMDVSQPSRLRTIAQKTFYEGPQSKGMQWLDTRQNRWYVLMKDELLVFDSHQLVELGRIPCRQQFDMKRLTGGGAFRLWASNGRTPLWALGHDEEMALARLEVTAQGLEVRERLAIPPSDYPLMSPPVVLQAGSRLYVSDGGDLHVIDVAGPPRRLQTIKFRYGLHLAAVESAPRPSP